MTETGRALDSRLASLAEQYGFGFDAVRHLYDAVHQGGGDMAVFDHPAFLGPGQWMRGGLIMITDPADRVLRNRIDAVCNALSRMLREDVPEAGASHRRIRVDARAWDTGGNLRRPWWPEALGEPDVAGETDRLAYAWFSASGRLAVRRGEAIAWYDTGDQRITGLAHDPDGSNDTLVMTSTRAEVPVADFDRLWDEPAAEAEPVGHREREILGAIERLGELYRQGVLTENEFQAKKQALLARL